MRNSHNDPPNNKGCPKGTINSVTRRRYLLRHWRTPATMYMVEKRSGIRRESITRPRIELCDMGLLVEVGTEKQPCKVSGKKAMYYVAASGVTFR